ncbi:MAG: ATP-binding protein [Streptosporangiaceae bacterium]
MAQARAGELGQIDFLQVLYEDEISRRQATSMTRRLRQARFEEQATLEGFDFTASPKLPAAQIRDLAALRWLHAGESVILYPPAIEVSCDDRSPRVAAVRRCPRSRATPRGDPDDTG